MSTLVCNHEIRPDFPIMENALERARTRFDEAVAIARQLADAERSWVRLGRLLTIMERDQDYKRLGFDSIHSCIQEIKVLTGYGRSSMYAFKKLYEEAASNGAEVPEMPLSSAHVFKKLPAKVQRDPAVFEAAKTLKPKKFKTKMVQECPEAHLDDSEDIRLHLDGSVLDLWREALEGARLLNGDPAMTYEQFLELELLADWLEEKRPLIESLKCQSPKN